MNFTNKAHFSNRFVELRWEEDDLWRLVLRQALQASQLADLVQQEAGVQIEWLDTIEQEQLRRGLYPLWGERMGRGNKSYTHNWIRKRITDSQNNRFPRSLIVLLQRAIEFEKAYTDRNRPMNNSGTKTNAMEIFHKVLPPHRTCACFSAAAGHDQAPLA